MTTPTAPQQVLTLSTSAGIAEAIPHLLGHTPRERLVVVGLRGRRVGLTVAFDLEQVPDGDAHRARAAGQQIAHTLLRDGTTRVILALCTTGPRMGLMRATDEQCVAAGLEVVDRLVIGDGEWSSLDSLHPPQPVPLTEVSAALADGTGLPGERGDLLAELAPRTLEPAAADELWTAVGEAFLRQLTDRVGLCAQTITWLAADHPIIPGEAGTVLAALADATIRDTCLAVLANDATRDRVLERLAWLASVADDKLIATPLVMWALGRYIAGNGTAANMALDQALLSTPDHRLGKLARQALSIGLPPQMIREMLHSSSLAARKVLGL